MRSCIAVSSFFKAGIFDMTIFGQGRIFVKVVSEFSRIYCSDQILIIEDVRESMQMIFNLFYYLFSNLYFLDFMQPYFYFVLTTERYIRVFVRNVLYK